MAKDNGQKEKHWYAKHLIHAPHKPQNWLFQNFTKSIIKTFSFHPLSIQLGNDHLIF
jgi:hypothetical protein